MATVTAESPAASRRIASLMRSKGVVTLRVAQAMMATDISALNKRIATVSQTAMR